MPNRSPADDPSQPPAAALPVAVIVHGAAPHGSDALIAAFARDLIDRGHRLCGVIQSRASSGDCDAQGCEVDGEHTALVDLRGGSSYRLFQALGAGSQSCRVDPQAVAEASGVLREAQALDAELVIVNRFGALEAGGEGFASEMLALMSNGIPLLTVVSGKHLADWRRFTGGLGSELPPRREALEAWFAGLCRAAN